jgi:hypothetical protein
VVLGVSLLRVLEERVVVGVSLLRVLDERVSTVERVGVVPRVSELLRVVVPRVSVVLRVSVVPRVSEVPRVVVPRVSVVPRDSLVVRVVEGVVVALPRELPVVRLVPVEEPVVWLLLTCVPVEGLWSRVISAVLMVGFPEPGAQVPVGMGAGVLGWRI